MTNINFVSLSPVSLQVLAAHRAYSHRLGIPEVGFRPVAARLAVVGGSPSVVDHIEELQNFDGEVWAINGAFKWCQDNGIDATFYGIDPTIGHSPAAGLDLIDGAERAILADIIAPVVFDELQKNWCDIELARIGEGEIQHGSAAACTAPFIALRRGHKHITFFGCAQSSTTTSHIYKDDPIDNQLWVECGGDEYRTTSQNVMQAELIAELARAFPTFIHVAGDGFLPALIKHGDFNVTHVSRCIHESLKEVA